MVGSVNFIVFNMLRAVTKMKRRKAKKNCVKLRSDQKAQKAERMPKEQKRETLIFYSPNYYTFISQGLTFKKHKDFNRGLF